MREKRDRESAGFLVLGENQKYQKDRKFCILVPKISSG